MRRDVWRAPFVLYVTERFLQRRYPTQGVAGSGSDVEIGELDESVLARRLARCAGDRGVLVFGHVGSLSTRSKGLHTLLKALRMAKETLPRFELRVLGPGDPGPWDAMVQRLGLDGHVRFDGVIPAGSPVFSWLDDIDLYFQPSFQEGLPRALIEAMSRACPALGSTAGGIPELLDSDCLHKPGDEAALARLIITRAENRNWLMAQAMRNFEVSKRYVGSVVQQARREFWLAFRLYVLQHRSFIQSAAKPCSR